MKNFFEKPGMTPNKQYKEKPVAKAANSCNAPVVLSPQAGHKQEVSKMEQR